jgi:hypothetical protein
MIPTCCAGHRDIPDSGKTQPVFYRFRQPFISVKIREKPLCCAEVLSKDGAIISKVLWSDKFNVEFDGFSLELRKKSGITWHRINFDWYGFELYDMESILKLIEPLSPWLHWLNWKKQENKASWVQALVGNKKIELTGDAISIINQFKAFPNGFSSGLNFGLWGTCYYYIKDGRWSNMSNKVSESQVLEELSCKLTEYTNMHNDYIDSINRLKTMGIL